jgi:ABC-type lipoprotein export system ATPase subunit
MSGVHDLRGSMWHRWDPHLHAPGTLLNDQFGGDWDAYLAKIEKSDPRIEALGVTDYFCIETYKEVRKRKAAGRLKDVTLLFPNVELRIETKTTADRAINIHLLFSPADPDHVEQIERILGQLTFEYGERDYACTKADLIALGKAHDPKQADEFGAWKTGANQFKTSLRDLKSRFKAERWMRENCLVAIACKTGDGTSGLKDDDAFSAMRRELETFADIMLTSRPKDRVFWLGEQPGMGRDFIEKHFRVLKPCLHGSDAHAEEDTGVPEQDRLCWLKGDLTFETLRQAVVEPGERVWIGAHPPSQAIPALTIQKVTFNSAPWMKKDAVDLNDGLVAIIGARGSGKTALADIVAMGAHADDAGKGEASFLKRASSPVDHLGAAAVSLTWGDDSLTGRRMLPGGGLDEPEAVRYLSQHFVEKLCSSAGLATELRGAMDRVVFESTDPLERLETESFDELADLLLEPIRTTYADLQEQIDTIGDAIVQEEIMRDGLQKMTREREALAKKIESAKKEQQKLIPKGNEERAKQLAALETACTNAQAKVETLRLRLKMIDDLNTAAAYLVGTTEQTRLAAMQQKFASAGLTAEEWKAFQLRFSGDTAAAISAARLRTDKAITIAVEGDPAVTIDPATTTTPHVQWPLNLLKAERDKAKAAVGIDADRKRKYDEAQKQIGIDELALTRLDAQIVQAQGADARRTAHIELRRKLYLQVFAQLVKEEGVLSTLYAPLKTRLVDAKGALGKLAFVTERTIDLDDWCERGEDQFDLRSGNRVRGRGGIKKLAEEHLVPAWRSGTAEDVAAAMDTFRTEIQKEMRTLPPWVPNDEERRRAWYKAISAWLYSTDHIKLRYGIEYDGVAIEQLSPGTRGVVLLLLYLAVDLHDQRPLIIDQPEENLDPNSVFEELVPHFRDARKRRQVIIVTHNANLVVNTDADQVIVASSARGAGAGLPDIAYDTGSLENPEIRGLVCQLLEGGERAFLERERRYRLRWGHNLLEEA